MSGASVKKAADDGFTRELAGECANCHGSGLVTITNYDGNRSDADEQHCPDCADIRELLP